MGYIGMCHCEGYGFKHFQGKEIQFALAGNLSYPSSSYRGSTVLLVEDFGRHKVNRELTLKKMQLANLNVNLPAAQFYSNKLASEVSGKW